MKLTRKQFLGRLTTGLVGTALGSSILKAAGLRRTPAPPVPPGFESQVGTSFQIRDAGRDVTQLLLNRFESKAPSNGTTQFSLEFASQSDVSLQERTYDVQHAALGNFRMFVMPLPADAQGRALYRADFNLLG
jgi:hypothetical protein